MTKYQRTPGSVPWWQAIVPGSSPYMVCGKWIQARAQRFWRGVFKLKVPSPDQMFIFRGREYSWLFKAQSAKS